ncbi:MAG TPA: hypothetical protein VES66_10335 [Terriglobales bacterium]|nr:hypothetical protein [Terriglobales bacterium]
MALRAIWLGGLLFALCTIAGWAQAQPANADPCRPQPQQLAVATPPAAIQPATPGENASQPPFQQQLSKREKFKVFVQYTYSPYTFGGAVFDAGLAQATGAWHSYGGGMEGYGKRYGASLADSESGAFFGRFLFPVLLHEDPRYLRSTSHNTMPRIGYALSRVLVTHDDNGDKRANFSLILSVFAASGLANTYYPREERGFGDTAARAGGDLLSAAGMNVLREFWPDIRQKFKKHEPKRIQRLEESPRVSKLEQMVMGPTAPPQCPAENHPEQTGNH